MEELCYAGFGKTIVLTDMHIWHSEKITCVGVGGNTGDFRIAKSNSKLHPGDMVKVITYHRISGAIILSSEHRI